MIITPGIILSTLFLTLPFSIPLACFLFISPQIYSSRCLFLHIVYPRFLSSYPFLFLHLSSSLFLFLHILYHRFLSSSHFISFSLSAYLCSFLTSWNRCVCNSSFLSFFLFVHRTMYLIYILICPSLFIFMYIS